MTAPDTCPVCKADLRGPPIPQGLRDKGYYAPDATHYLRTIGIYDNERDFTYAWQCPDCKHQWRRNT